MALPWLSRDISPVCTKLGGSSFLNPRPKTPTLKLNSKQKLLEKKTKFITEKKRKTEYAPRIGPAKPPKPDGKETAH